jgi:ABC-type multidrug transport system ATPase subunit
MFELKAQGLGKKFYRHWVFRDIDLHLQTGDRLLVTGANGAGKSTLVRVLSGQLTPSAGSLHMTLDGKAIDPEVAHRVLSWSGPYMDLYPDLTLREAVDMHFRFRDGLLPQAEVIQQLRLQDHADKLLRHFSSGMLQRVKVGLAIFTQAPLLLLDEATATMDESNARYIYDLTHAHLGDRVLVYASNNAGEFERFERRLEL